MKSRKPVDVIGRGFDQANDLSKWYMEKLLYTGPTVTYSMIGISFYGAGFLGGKYLTGAGVGGRVGGAVAMKVWRDLQVGALFSAARHRVPIGNALGLVAGTVLAHETVTLPSTVLSSTVDTSEIGYEGSGAYSVTGGSSDWTPLDLISWIWD